LDEDSGSRLVVEDLFRVYKTEFLEVISLRGVNLRLEEAESVALVGPSGSGKTTLLNLIGGLDRPTAGRIVVEGVDITTLSDNEVVTYKREKVGFVFQFFNLIPNLSALKNVELPLAAVKVSGSDRRRRALELLEMVGIRDRAGRKPSQLSGGEQQRVAVAAALANDPPLILADEPTGELDTETGAALLDLFRDLKADLGKSELIVTHDTRVGRTVDRSLRIQDGIIIGDSQIVDRGSLGLGDLVEENRELKGKIERIKRLARSLPPDG
jgi:putative ABC transport system ATP-binding protein